jgi:hypothetical protein
MFFAYERGLQPLQSVARRIVDRRVLHLVWSVLADFAVAGLVETEILMLRHQLNVQHRHLPKRPAFSAMDLLGCIVCANFHQGA